MMERFLERISLSEYKNQFILKGGMLVAAMVGLDARATMDLDATIKGTNVSVEDVEMIISKIISIPLNDARHLWQEYMFSNSNCHIRDWSYRNSFAALTELVFILQ